MSAVAAAGVVGSDRPAIRIDRRFGAAAANVVKNWKWPLACAAAVGLIDMIWARAAGLTFGGLAEALLSIAAFLVIGAAWQATGAVLGERAGAPRWVLRLEQLGIGMTYFGTWCAVALAVAVYSYLCGRVGLPFRDAAFADFDRQLGFDWMRWAATVAAHPWLKAALSYSYHSHVWQAVAVFFVAAFSGDPRRPVECFWIVAVSALAACTISILVPAIGATVHFGAGTSNWVADVTLLRLPAPAAFELNQLKGIVSMPSFHTMLGVCFIWSSRRTGIVGLGFVALNLAMIVSTISEGGHYLVDVLAGLALAVVVIAAVNRLIYRDFKPA